MKVMNKRRVKAHQSEKLCWNERRILSLVDSPFVVCLKYAFTSKEDLFLILDLMRGGDLAFHLDKRGRFSMDEARYFAARTLLGLQHLHKNGIVYRWVFGVGEFACVRACVRCFGWWMCVCVGDDVDRAVVDCWLTAISIANPYNPTSTHRDLKPDNILMDERGKTRISDLGLACKVTPDLVGTYGTRGCEWCLVFICGVDV